MTVMQQFQNCSGLQSKVLLPVLCFTVFYHEILTEMLQHISNTFKDKLIITVEIKTYKTLQWMLLFRQNKAIMLCQNVSDKQQPIQLILYEIMTNKTEPGLKIARPFGKVCSWWHACCKSDKRRVSFYWDQIQAKNTHLFSSFLFKTLAGRFTGNTVSLPALCLL